MQGFWFIVFYLGLVPASAKLSHHSLSAPETRSTETWSADAMRLSGESARVYQQSLQRLRTNPHLDAELRKALLENNTHTYLALDVISALRRESMFSDLLADAKKDEGGFFYITLNAFFNPVHQKQLTEFYEGALADEKSSGAVKMIILDTFGRIGHALPKSEIKKLLDDQRAPEVRSAALYYVRSFIKRNDRESLDLLHDLHETRELSRRNEKSKDEVWIAQLDAVLAENGLSNSRNDHR